jgi:hypothetical protein
MSGAVVIAHAQRNSLVKLNEFGRYGLIPEPAVCWVERGQFLAIGY